jgi:hypothetical protein
LEQLDEHLHLQHDAHPLTERVAVIRPDCTHPQVIM